MPKTSVPATTGTAVAIIFGEEQKKDYSFFNDRWEGEDSWCSANAAMLHFTKQGWKAGIHEGTHDKWVGGKKTTEVYFKLYFTNPEDKSLYAWWSPLASEWLDVPEAAVLTWFEFVQDDKK